MACCQWSCQSGIWRLALYRSMSQSRTWGSSASSTHQLPLPFVWSWQLLWRWWDDLQMWGQLRPGHASTEHLSTLISYPVVDTLNVHLTKNLVSGWGCKWVQTEEERCRASMQGTSKYTLPHPPTTSWIRGGLTFFNKSLFFPSILFPLRLCWSPFSVNCTSWDRVPQLSSKLHLNHPTYFFVFAFNLPPLNLWKFNLMFLL